MLQRIKSGLLCASVLLSANCLAMTYELVPNQGLNYEIELPPNEAQTLANPLFWTVTANCTISTEDQNNEILIEVMNKTGKVNGTSLSQGESLLVNVHSGDQFIISADSGAKVKMTNQGKGSVTASCTV
ncbi:MAG: hypothetical protein WC785_06200 [Tatlockia sp.]|jgi:hypothetical protein